MAGAHPIRPFAAAIALAAAACSKAPAEPDAPPPAASAETVPPLAWDAPGTWTVLTVPPKGPKKAAYHIHTAGNDKEEAELNVVYMGTGEKADPAKVFKDWFDQFDGNVGPGAQREQFDAKGGFKVETVEVGGTFKMSLTPPVGPKKRAPVQMVKQGYRLYGAVVRTKDRGNWYFRMTGPDETVQSARSAMRSMLETVR